MSWAARSATSPIVAERRLACHRHDKTRHAHSPLDGYARWGAQLIAPRPRSPPLGLREERQLLALRPFLAPAPTPAPAPAPALALTLDSSPSLGTALPISWRTERERVGARSSGGCPCRWERACRVLLFRWHASRLSATAGLVAALAAITIKIIQARAAGRVLATRSLTKSRRKRAQHGRPSLDRPHTHSGPSC